MCYDDLADGVSIDKAHEEDEWDEMLVQDNRLQIEVGCNQRPRDEARD